MSTEDDLSQNLDDISGLADQLVQLIVDKDKIAADLRAELAAAAAAGTLTQEKVKAAFDKSEAAENKLRALVPGIPPVGGTPLLNSYANEADFRIAAGAYTGPEAVTLDGNEIKAGTAPSLDYFSHSADSSVSTSGPQD